MRKILLLFLFAPILVFGQGTMDFESIGVLTSVYQDGSFTDAGITYTYGQSRDQDTYPITGEGLMLRRASESYFEWTVANGIGELSFEYRKAFTGASTRQLEIIVNGTQVALTPEFGTGTGEQTTVYTFTYTIDEASSTTIKIKNVGATTTSTQSVIDNISWTAAPVVVDCSSFTASIDGNLEFCSGGSTTLSVASSDNISSYLWNDNSTNATLQVTQAGSYSVTVTNTDNCVLTIPASVVTITPLPTVGTIGTTDNSNGSYTFAATGTANVVAYNWDFGDGNSSTSANPTHTYTSEGTYTVIVTVINSCGETATSTTQVVYSTAGLTSLSSSSVKLYPNPANDFVTIVHNGSSNIESIVVINSIGQIIYSSKEISNATSTIDVRNFATGLYSLNISLTTGELVRTKFEITK